MAIDLDDDDGGGEEGGAPWMATFADLATLLLTFFVLLLSFANMDVVKFRMALGSVQDALGVNSQHPGDFAALSTSPIELSNVESAVNPDLMEQLELLKTVEQMLKDEGLESTVEANINERGIALRVKGTVLFAAGSDKLLSGAGRTLYGITEVTKKIGMPLVVEGHTDPRPIRTSRFPSNWELSSARAIATMRYLVEKGKLAPKRVSVAGYAHLRPIATNRTSKGRAKNRRVEFLFLHTAKRKTVKNTKALESTINKDAGNALRPSVTGRNVKDGVAPATVDQPKTKGSGSPNSSRPEPDQPPSFPSPKDTSNEREPRPAPTTSPPVPVRPNTTPPVGTPGAVTRPADSKTGE